MSNYGPGKPQNPIKDKPSEWEVIKRGVVKSAKPLEKVVVVLLGIPYAIIMGILEIFKRYQYANGKEVMKKSGEWQSHWDEE
jgi:hypothetical protein